MRDGASSSPLDLPLVIQGDLRVQGHRSSPLAQQWSPAGTGHSPPAGSTAWSWRSLRASSEPPAYFLEATFVFAPWTFTLPREAAAQE